MPDSTADPFSQDQAEPDDHFTIRVPMTLSEQVRNYSYWSRKSIKEICIEAFSEYFADKAKQRNLRSRPTGWHRTKKKRKG